MAKDPSAQSAKDAVYVEYRQFCDSEGITEKPKQTLSKRLKQALNVEMSKPTVEGEQVAHYRGIQLKSEEGLLERSDSVI